MRVHACLEESWSVRAVALGVLLLAVASLAAPAAAQGAGLPGSGVGGGQDRLALMTTVAGLRFLTEDPDLALDDDQAEAVLQVLKEIAESEVLFPLARYDARTLGFLGLQADSGTAAPTGPGGEDRWAQVGEGVLEADQALRNLLRRDQAAFIDGLDLSTIVSAELRSTPAAGAAPGNSGQPSSVQLLLAELVEILAWQLGL